MVIIWKYNDNEPIPFFIDGIRYLLFEKYLRKTLYKQPPAKPVVVTGSPFSGLPAGAHSRL